MIWSGFLFTLVLQWFAALTAALPKGSRLEEVYLSTRDNVLLHTMIVYPRDGNDGSVKYPTIIDRSPYGYQDLEWFADILVPFGFVAIGQDMRGTEKSEGNFTMWQADKYDSEDLGNWIVQQKWSNGVVMTLGASADGIASMQTPMNNPSWLGPQYIIWAPSAMYEILFPGGAYKQETAEDWLLGVEMPNPDFVYTDIQLVHENEAHTDFWRQIEMSPDVYKNVRGKNAFWGGWYDLFIVGTLTAFDGYNTMSDPSVRHTSVITIDPLGHCLDATDFFTEDVLQGRTLLVLGQMLETYGIMPVVRNNIKNVTFYVMSSNDDAGKEAGQFWTTLETFPKPKMTDYYLHGDHTATTSKPDDSIPSSTYKYDPANPIPTLGGNNLCPDIGGSIACGPMDQSSLDTRSDLLVFETPKMGEDEELALTGPLFATLYVSSDAVDTDFMVKISDLYPNGEARIIQDNAVRMRWRQGGLTPVYMESGKVYEVEMNLWNTSYVVAPGHALRIVISSSNNPRFSVNPNNGLLLADPAYPGENITATNTLYHSSQYPSRITLPVVNKRLQLPETHIIKEMQTAYPVLTDEIVAKATKGFASWSRRMSRRGRK